MLILRGVDDKGTTPVCLFVVFLGFKCKLSYLLFSGVFLILYTLSTKELESFFLFTQLRKGLTWGLPGAFWPAGEV